MFISKKVLVGFVLLILAQQVCFVAYLKSSFARQEAVVSVLAASATLGRANVAYDLMTRGLVGISDYLGAGGIDNQAAVHRNEVENFKKVSQNARNVVAAQAQTRYVLIANILLPTLIIYALFFSFFGKNRTQLATAMLLPPVGIVMMVNAAWSGKKD